MDWNLLSIVPMIFMGIVFLLMLYAGGKLWKVNNKFLGLMCFAAAAGLAIGFYAIYGKKIFG
jgi:hypothetical protein